MLQRISSSPRFCSLLAAAVLAGALSPAGAAEGAAGESYALVRLLMSERRSERKEAAQKLLASRDVQLVPALVDALFFTPKLARAEMLDVLRGLAEPITLSY